jgi:dTDP-4-dehydrorhamnose 3,5-epimerase-like enzyme
MRIEKEVLNGVVLIQPLALKDDRGDFVKIFNTEWYLKMNIPFIGMEEYYSISKKNVI